MWAKRVLHPTTKWGRITVWLGIMCVVLWIADAVPGAKLGGWAVFTSLVFAFFALILLCRWGYRPLLWRLRNRLIVTYLFIGVMPILLLLLMGGGAGYLFAGQFATYVATSDLYSELLHLQAANDALAAQLFPMESSGKLNEQITGELTRASDERFPGRTVTVLRNEKSFVLSTGGALLKAPAAPVPGFISGDFTGYVVDQGSLHLRTVKLGGESSRRIALVSDIPITPNLLVPTAARLGIVKLYPPGREDGKPHRTTDNAVISGQLPPRSHWFDLALEFPTILDTVDWQTGEKREDGLIDVATRPSMLFATLFATLGDSALIVRDILLAIAIFFAVIELVALYIGIRLSRSMTASVAGLYRATEHVNSGDLTHRITLEGRDQMAALGHSFNSMTASLAKLIEEQKEKQRLENELSIAYEVQELLFPRQVTDLPYPRGARRLRSGAHGQRRLLRLYSPGQRPDGARGRRHQRKRNFRSAVDGHGTRLRARLFPGTGDGLDARLVGLWLS